jgi:AraC family transcriptional activator FtrA
VVALVREPQSTFELACAAEVFGITRPGSPNPYSFEVCAEAPGDVPTRAGYAMRVTGGLEALGAARTVVLAGWPLDVEPSDALLTALRDAHASGARVVGLCSGSFLLAASGLMAGRTITTHWRMAAELASRHPGVPVDPRALYVDHGDVASSAGTAAAVDLCLHLVRADQGAAYADLVARHMVMPPHREGGQTQFVPTQVAGPPPTLARLTSWADHHLADGGSVEEMAAAAGMSARSLSRHFQRELGISPGRWLLHLRVRQACSLLEETDLTVDAVAGRVGFRDVGNFRRRFHDRVGTTPVAYRRAFRRRPDHA